MSLDLTADVGSDNVQAITRTNVDPDLCHHVVSLGHTELTNKPRPETKLTQIYDTIWHHQGTNELTRWPLGAVVVILKV